MILNIHFLLCKYNVNINCQHNIEINLTLSIKCTYTIAQNTSNNRRVSIVILLTCLLAIMLCPQCYDFCKKLYILRHIFSFMLPFGCSVNNGWWQYFIMLIWQTVYDLKNHNWSTLKLISNLYIFFLPFIVLSQCEFWRVWLCVWILMTNHGQESWDRSL